MSIHTGPDTLYLAHTHLLRAGQSGTKGHLECHSSTRYLEGPSGCSSRVLVFNDLTSAISHTFPCSCGASCLRSLESSQSPGPKLRPKLRRIWDRLKGRHLNFSVGFL